VIPIDGREDMPATKAGHGWNPSCEAGAPQAWETFSVAGAFPGGEGENLRQPQKKRAALLVETALKASHFGPLIVTHHWIRDMMNERNGNLGMLHRGANLRGRVLPKGEGNR
jgi:hypothetical protein